MNALGILSDERVIDPVLHAISLIDSCGGELHIARRIALLNAFYGDPSKSEYWVRVEHALGDGSAAA